MDIDLDCLALIIVVALACPLLLPEILEKEEMLKDENKTE